MAAYRADGLLKWADGSADHYTALLRDTATRDAQAEVWVAVDDHDRLLGTVTWCPPGSLWREVAQHDHEAEFRMLAGRRRSVAVARLGYWSRPAWTARAPRGCGPWCCRRWRR